MKGFINALKEGLAYDYIANNYFSMSKEDLRTILLEFIYEADKESKQNVIETLLSYVAEEEADDSNRGCSDCPDDECTGHCMSCSYRSV